MSVAAAKKSFPWPEIILTAMVSSILGAVFGVAGQDYLHPRLVAPIEVVCVQ